VKVALLLTQGTGGPADHVADVAPALAARGHEVVVVMPGGAAARRVEASGVRRLDLSLTSARDVAGVAALAALLGRLRPDVLHAHDRRAGLYGRLLGRARGVPRLVYTLHGVPDGLSYLVAGNAAAGRERPLDRTRYLTLERWLTLRTGALVVTPSHATGEYLRRRVGLATDRVRVVPNGIDPEPYAVPDRAARPRRRLLWLGLMEPVKRVDVLLDAVRDCPDVDLVLAGDGPLRPALEARAADLGGRVTFAGFTDDVRPLLAACDTFVLSSAAENVPLALLRAMAAGMAPVATRVGGVPEVVRDGVDGLLVPPGDPAALAAALASLDTGRVMAFGRASAERVAAAFRVERCAEGLEEAYEAAAR
jgi:glycosyltransferase involved in cell wall biosynthesis